MNKREIFLQEQKFQIDKLSQKQLLLQELDGFDYVQILSTKTPKGFEVHYTKEKTRMPSDFTVEYDPKEVEGRAPVPGVFIVVLTAMMSKGDTQEELEFVVPVVVEHSNEMPNRKPKEENPDCLACKNCNNFFSDTVESLKPKMMPDCGHSFCSNCISNMTKEFISLDQFDEKKLWTLKCPACDVESLTCKNELPVNHGLIDAIIKIKKEEVEELSTEKVEDPIVKCYEDENHEADVFCEECEEAYCEKCFTKAHKIKILSTHTSIPVDQMPPRIPKCLICPDVKAEFICHRESCYERRLVCNKCRCKYHSKHVACKKIGIVLKANEEHLNSQLQKLKNGQETVRKLIQEANGLIDGRNPKPEQFLQQEEEVKNTIDKQMQKKLRLFRSFCNNQISVLDETRRVVAGRIKTHDEIKLKIEKNLKRKNQLHDVDWVKQVDELVAYDYSDANFLKLDDYDFERSWSTKPMPKRLRLNEPADDTPTTLSGTADQN